MDRSDLDNLMILVSAGHRQPKDAADEIWAEIMKGREIIDVTQEATDE